ncbi:MAG: hypothetical protein QXQ53_01195 [Candidatus Methanosuratincola sp.]
MTKILTHTLKTIATMNSYVDSTSLADNEVQLVENMRPDKGTLQTREGMTKHNSSPLPSSTGIFGLAPYYPDPSTELLLAVSNGKLYSGSGGTFTERYSGLNSSNLCQIVQLGDKALVVDQSTGILVYKHDDTPYYAGLPSPKTYVTIATFEPNETWSVSSGSKVADKTHFVEGTQAITFTTNVGATMTASYTFPSTKNLTIFSDGSTSSVCDYISLFFLRADYSSFVSCYLDLGDSTFSNYFRTNLVDEDAWLSSTAANVVLDFKIRKRRFQSVGSPSWSSISAVRFVVTASSGQQASFTVDFLRLERTGPIAHEYCKQIASFESDETWSTGSGIGFDYKYRVDGDRSLTITNNNSTSRTVSLDLTTFDDGVESSDIDDIRIYVGKTSSTSSPTLTLKLATNDTNYFSYTIPVAAMTKPNYELVEINIPKSSFSSTGSPTWSNITSLTLTASNNSGHTLYIDAWSLVKHKDIKLIRAMEPTETWTEVTSNAVTQKWDTAHIRGEEGSTSSLMFKVKSGKDEGTLQSSLTLDLSSYDSGVAVQTDDTIGLWVYVPNYKTVRKITLRLKTDSSNYFELSIEQSALNQKTNSWNALFYPLSDWAEIGSPSWSNLTLAEITVTPTSSSGTTLYFDSWVLRRTDKLSGTYFYRLTYCDANGVESDSSLISEPITVKGASIYIDSLPCPSSPRVASKRLYRLGGLSSEWRLVATIPNKDQTYYVDSVSDSELGSVFVERTTTPYLPKAITVHDDRVVIANLTSPDGVSYPTGLMVSEPYSVDVYNPSSLIEIGPNSGGQILWLISAFGYVYVGKENSIWRVNPNALTERPVLETENFGAVGPLAVCHGDNEFYFLSHKDIVSYNGSHFQSISYPVKNYIESIPESYIHTSWLAYYDNTLFCGIPTSSSSYPNLILAYHVPTKFWYIITGWSFRCVTTNSSFFGGSATSGYIYSLFTGDDDDGTPITSIITTKDYDFNLPHIFKDIERVYLVGNRLTSTHTAVTLIPRFDLTTTPTIGTRLTSLHSTLHDRLDIPLYQAGSGVTYIGLTLTSTSRWNFRSLTMKIRLKETSNDTA